MMCVCYSIIIHILYMYSLYYIARLRDCDCFSSINYRTEILDEYENADFEFKSPCLITSCKACVFVEDQAPSEWSPCVSCEVDDEACMIAYGQCVMRYLKFITVRVSATTAYTHERQVYVLKASSSEDASSKVHIWHIGLFLQLIMQPLGNLPLRSGRKGRVLCKVPM